MMKFVHFFLICGIFIHFYTIQHTAIVVLTCKTWFFSPRNWFLLRYVSVIVLTSVLFIATLHSLFNLIDKWMRNAKMKSLSKFISIFKACAMCLLEIHQWKNLFTWLAAESFQKVSHYEVVYLIRIYGSSLFSFSLH